MNCDYDHVKWKVIGFFLSFLKIYFHSENENEFHTASDKNHFHHLDRASLV